MFFCCCLFSHPLLIFIAHPFPSYFIGIGSRRRREPSRATSLGMFPSSLSLPFLFPFSSLSLPFLFPFSSLSLPFSPTYHIPLSPSLNFVRALQINWWVCSIWEHPHIQIWVALELI